MVEPALGGLCRLLLKLRFDRRVERKAIHFAYQSNSGGCLRMVCAEFGWRRLKREAESGIQGGSGGGDGGGQRKSPPSEAKKREKRKGNKKRSLSTLEQRVTQIELPR